MHALFVLQQYGFQEFFSGDTAQYGIQCEMLQNCGNGFLPVFTADQGFFQRLYRCQGKKIA